jgi:nucleotide-binding universal stress UspA family protein
MKYMKSLLVATDFSPGANHAAEYAYRLAAELRRDLVLCNAFFVPSDAPDAAMVAWPLAEYEELNEESEAELKSLKDQLIKNDHNFSFKPGINTIHEAGTIVELLNVIADEGNTELTVLSTHTRSGLSALIMGNHSRQMIDTTKGLLLLVPPTAKVAPIKKIAFATDFSDPENDLKIIYKLIQIIRPLNAELLITHINHEAWPETKWRESLEQFLIEISNKANYPQIFYRIVRSEKAEKGLEWLCDHGQVDVLAMVHRDHGILAEIISGSHAKKMAGMINIPLLVIPENFGK